MVDRKQLETLIGKMNGLNLYTWVETDLEGRVRGVGSQSWRGILNPLVAYDMMLEIV